MMKDNLTAQMPTRLVEAFKSKQLLTEQNIFFAPVRHHSPACAFALKQYIEQIQPTHILIEAPTSFQFLLASLQDTETRPPIAIFAQAIERTDKKKKSENEQIENTPNIYSSYFPFCEYSPEWVAIQQAKTVQAQVQFIDLSWSKQSALKTEKLSLDWQQKNLISERYLAHSQYIQKLADKLHCRNHDELWDHLFELQAIAQLQNPHHFFDDVFAWCAMARLDYEQDVLLQEASLHREDQMWQCIENIRQLEHRILVVTGGFHTLALIENLVQPQSAQRYIVQEKQQTWQENAWLIRYSFDRLDALNGYASGMPSPAYYQNIWQHLNSDSLKNADFYHMQFFQYLNELCHVLDEKNALDITPYIALKNTAELAWQLAELRGHHYPSRYDLLDALQTALVKGELGDGQQHLLNQIHLFLSGQKLGQVAAHEHSPALLQNTYQKIKQFRFNLNDTTFRTRKLDVYRKSTHQDISQFLHLLDFVQVKFADRLSGPDFVHGTSLDLLFEEWRYAWTPSVEARLIELAEMGNQLEQIALVRLKKIQLENEANGVAQSAHETAKLLALACRLGLKQQLELLSQDLNHFIKSDQNLSSMIGSAQQLYYLWHGRKLFNIPEVELQQSLQNALEHVCYLLDQLYDTNEDKIEQNLKCLKTLHELVLNYSRKIKSDHQSIDLLELMYQHIDLEKLKVFELSKMKGAVDVLLYLDHKATQQDLQQQLKLAFAIGSDPEQSVNYLHGMFFIAPEIFVQSLIAIEALHELVSHWDEETFIQILPDLRYIFSQLTPKQSTELSKTIAQITGLSDDIILDDVMSHISENDVLHGLALNQQLQKMFEFDHLNQWITHKKASQGEDHV